MTPGAPAAADRSLAARRRAARRTAWLLGGLVALLYVGGLLVAR